MSESQGGPWIVTGIGQGGMVDDWWQSAPGKIAALPTLRWEYGWKSAAIFPIYIWYSVFWYLAAILTLKTKMAARRHLKGIGMDGHINMCKSFIGQCGFLHQWNWHFIFVISPPWYNPGCCQGVKPLTNKWNVAKFVYSSISCLS